MVELLSEDETKAEVVGKEAVARNRQLRNNREQKDDTKQR